MTKDFNIEDAIKALQSRQGLTGKDGVLTPLIKQLTEAALKAELEQHLESDEQPIVEMAPARKRLNPPLARLNSIPLVTVPVRLSQSW